MAIVLGMPEDLLEKLKSPEEIQGFLKTVMELQGTVQSPSAEVCEKIAQLQGLFEISGSSGRSVREPQNWRREPSAQQYTPVHAQTHSQTHTQMRGPHNQKWASQKTYASVRQNENTGPIRYQSQFRNSEKAVEEKILNNIILSKLNKFSPATYVEIREFLYQILGSGEADLKEFVRDFMKLVFQKAASEEIFCPLYAKLLGEISSKYDVILEEMKSLSDNYLEIFDEVEEKVSGNYDEFVQKVKEKKYRLGYSQFIAELAKLEILPLPILSATFTKLVDLISLNLSEVTKRIVLEEYADCLLRMSRVFKGRNTVFTKLARQTLSPTIQALRNTIQNSCSSKVRFAIMDICDILVNNEKPAP
jgi:hypothetical protein